MFFVFLIHTDFILHDFHIISCFRFRTMGFEVLSLFLAQTNLFWRLLVLMGDKLGKNMGIGLVADFFYGLFLVLLIHTDIILWDFHRFLSRTMGFEVLSLFLARTNLFWVLLLGITLEKYPCRRGYLFNRDNN